jgi:phosphoribosylformylglycinamidine synthase
MKPRIGLVQFLGSNCDQDCIDAFARHFNIQLQTIWHTETELPAVDGLILPGGFSYGDFLRSGALAAHTRIMSAVKTFVSRGGAVLGICNGFQVLTEAQILPGVLLPNVGGQFICERVELKLGSGNSGYHRALSDRKIYHIPIAHGDGRYYVQDDTLKKLEDQGQILFRYAQNPNGSSRDIAGIISENGRVLGMMPHPERATESLLGSYDDGIAILSAFLESCV